MNTKKERETMNKKTIIEHTAEMVKSKLEGEGSGHDWFHIERVWKNAVTIGKEEKIELFVVELAALLHDLADDKIVENEEKAIDEITYFLEGEGVSDRISQQVLEIIQTISFKGGKAKQVLTKEGQVVQDADRLDAIGAIGIARAFTYAGSKGQPIFDPRYTVREEMTLEEYRKGETSTIHHFYEKLLKLKGLMNTDTALELAEKRHAFMEEYLEQFFNELNH